MNRALFSLAVAATLHGGGCKLTDLEAKFIAQPDAETARANLKYITSVEHMAGTPGDFKMAQFVHDKFVSFGLEARIEPVNTLLSFPARAKPPVLRILNTKDRSTVFKAGLAEKVLESDTTSDTWLRNHTYNGYAPSGDVTGPLVYANYGSPDDFATLEALGVDVKGKIVITRYGRCFRGLKVMNAQNRGAKGVLIYSDPEDDGTGKGDVYPQGPWRPEFSVQRGSVQFLSLCAGDPMRSELKRPVKEVCGYETNELIPQIPVLPISCGDARPLLESLGGPEAPEGFVGGLNITYRTGPSKKGLAVQLTTHNEFSVMPVWNVIATVPSDKFGTDDDRVIVLGNHRDAWVFGAVDPNSGTAVQLEVAKGFGALMKEGWKPKRTIIFASWSGEEMGLLGSTAWGEANAAMLSSKAIAYLNVDSGVSGPQFAAGGTPSLWSLLRSVAWDVQDPNTQMPMAEVWPGDVDIIGSGSDYTVFLDHLGVACVDMESRIDAYGPYGVYHSIYDSFSWMEAFGDPDFLYHEEMARYWGLMTLRLSEPEILPFNHTMEAEALVGFVTKLQDRVTQEDQKIDLTPLQEAVERYKAAADVVGQDLVRHVSGTMTVESSTKSLRRTSAVSSELHSSARSLNDRLAFTERRFLSPAGLPHRPWFKSIKQAPGLYLGYGAESFPGVTQALSDGEWAVAQQQVQVAADRVTKAADFLAGVEEGA